jgi:hypothetical protein
MKLSNFDKLHLNQRGFIIGGGPSILDLQEEGFDFEQLKKEITVGSNKAYKLFEPTYLFCLDRYYIREFKQELIDIASIKFIPNGYNKFNIPNTYNLLKDKVKTKHILPKNFTSPIPMSNNSGVASLKLAYLLGLNPIYLIGIDITHTDEQGRTHFHNDYDKNRIIKTKPDRYGLFYDSFLETLKALKDKNIEVISCSSVSKLNSDIPFVNINTLF